MSNAVDNRVVQLEMDNGSFEKNAGKSIKTLDKLDAALNLKNGRRSFDEVEQAAAKCNFKPLLSAADTVVAKFSAIEVAGLAALTNLTNKAVDAGLKMAKSLSIDQVTSGYSKYEQKTSNVQTLINSTGKSIEEINGYLDRLMWFSDETSYGFTDMTQALATMVSSGGDIDKIVPMIEGMANATAFAGKGAAEFNRVIYNLNKSYSQGSLSYMDWKSVQMAGASSKQLVETLIKAGEEARTIKKGQVTVDNFTDTLSKKWATREVMEKGFGYFDEMTQKAYEMIGTLDDQGNKIETASQAYDILSNKYDGVSINAAKAAQEAKSFTEAVDSTKDAVSSGWMRTFEIIVGNYEQAKTLWTDVANGLWNIFAGGFKDRNSMLEEVFQTSPVQKYAQSLEDAGVKFDEFKSKLKETYRENGKRMSDQEFETLTAGATTFEELLGQSWVKSSLLEKTIAKLPKDLSKTSSAAKKTTGNISDLLKDVNSGKYGYGLKNQQKALAEAGIDGSALGDNWLQQLYNANAHGNQEVIDGLNQTLFATEEVTDAASDQADVWEELAQKAKEFDNDGYYAKTDGRTIMLDGLKNVLSAVGERLDVVKQAWEKVFPPMTAERLRNIIISFHAFTEKLKMGSKESAILATVFERVFSVLGKVRDVVVAVGKVGAAALKLAGRFGQWFAKLEPVAKVISQIKDFFDGLHSDTLSGFDTAIQKITEFADTLNNLSTEDFDKLRKKMAPLIKMWNKLTVVAAPIIATIGSFFSEVGTWIYNNALTPLGVFIDKVISSEDPIGTLIEGVQAFGKKAAAAFKNLWDKLKAGDLKSIFSWFQKTFPSITGIIDKVSAAFQKLTTNADGTKKSLDFGKVISIITFAGLIATLAAIAKSLESIKNAADTIKTTFANVNKLFVSKFGNTFARNVQTVATACVSLALSLWLIASIPSEKLAAAAIALGSLMLVLGALAGVMTFVSTKLSKKNLKTITGLVKPMLGLSASILIVSFALKNAAAALNGTKDAKEGFTRVGEILALIGGIGLEIIGLTALMSLLPGKVKLMSVVMFIVAAALLKVTSALDMIKDLKLSEDAAQLLVGVGVLMFIISIISAIGDFYASKVPQVNGLSKITNVLLGLVAVIAGVYFAALAMEKLKTINLSDITSKWKEAIAILGVVVVVGTVLGIVGKFVKPAVSAAKDLGIGILAIVASLYLVTLLVERLAAIGDGGLIDSAATAMVWLVGVMAALTVALGYASKLSDGGKGVIKIAASLLVVVLGLTLMVGLLKIIDALFGQMEVKHIAKIGLILAGLVLLMAGLAIAVGFAGKLGGGKGTGVLIAAVVGVIALAAVLVVLTNFTWDQLAPGVIAIAITMVALGLMMYAIVSAVAATANSGAAGLGGLIASIVLIIVVAGALLVLSKIPLEGAVVAVAALAATMGALLGFLALLNKIKIKPSAITKVLVAIVMLAAVVTAINLLVPAFQTLSELPTEQFLANMVILVGGVTLLLVVVGVLAFVLGALQIAVPALLAIAGVLVAVGVLCVAFAVSMAILANVDYAAIAAGFAACLGPMYAMGGAGITLIIGAVGATLFALALLVLGLACAGAAGDLAAFSIALEFLLGILSAVGSAFQNSGGSIIGALANLKTELASSAQDVSKNAGVLKEALGEITGEPIVDFSGVGDDISKGLGQAGDSITENGSVVTDALNGVVNDAGDSAAKNSEKQGKRTALAWITGLGQGAKSIFGFGDLEVTPTTSQTPQRATPVTPRNKSAERSQMVTMGADDAIAYQEGVQSVTTQPQSSGNFLETLFGDFSSGDVTNLISSKLSEGLGGVDLTAITGVFSGDLMTGLENSDMATQLQTWMTGAMDGADFGSIGGTGADTLAESFSTDLASSKNTGAAKESATDLGNSAKNGLDSIDTESSGANFTQGFINGILSRIAGVTVAVHKVGTIATEGLAAAIDEGSPSKITKQSGKYFAEGFIIGINMNALYAVAAAYGMGVDTVDALNEGIQNGEVNRIVPVLDTSDIYSQMSDFDGTYRPVVKPTLDMSDVDPAFRNMTAVATVRGRTSSDDAPSVSEQVNTGTSVNFTQNNYSPKALSQVEIYRQTRNQLNTLKGMLKKS